MKSFTPDQKFVYLLSDTLYWAKQRPPLPGTTSCL